MSGASAVRTLRRVGSALPVLMASGSTRAACQFPPSKRSPSHGAHRLHARAQTDDRHARMVEREDLRPFGSGFGQSIGMDLSVKLFSVPRENIENGSRRWQWPNSIIALRQWRCADLNRMSLRASLRWQAEVLWGLVGGDLKKHAGPGSRLAAPAEPNAGRRSPRHGTCRRAA